MLAIDILKWPGMNQAFIFSFIVTLALALAIIPFGKRRKPGTPLSWGEAMLGSVYAFGVMFLAYGVVPHQWVDHADKELGWRKDKILFGPFDILKPKALGGNFPFTLAYEAVRDIVAVAIYGVYIGVMVFLFIWWQQRGKEAPKEIETSTYGRPLVRKS